MSAHTIPLPNNTPKNTIALSATQAGLIRERLELTLDQLELGDLDPLALRHVIAHLAPALRLAQRCQNKHDRKTGGAQ